MIHFRYPEPTDGSIFTEDTAENRLKHTFFLVEADTYAQHQLWATHSSDSIYPPWDTRKGHRLCPGLKWEQEGMGFMPYVGDIERKPIHVSLFWYRIEGRWVCFYYACSQVVDHRMIEAWLEQHFTGGAGKRAMCDAANFNHCLQAIKEANAAAQAAG